VSYVQFVKTKGVTIIVTHGSLFMRNATKARVRDELLRRCKPVSSPFGRR